MKLKPHDVSIQLGHNQDRLNRWIIDDQFKAGCKVEISFYDFFRSAYSNQGYNGAYSITMGPIYPEFFPSIKYHSMSDLIKDFDRQKLFYDGINYHELGHILWSPFAFFFKEVSKYKAQEFIKEFFNIIEDNVVEDRMMLFYPETTDGIMLVRTYFDNPELVDNLKGRIKDNPKNGNTFLSYMLIHLRGNQKLPAYDIWDDHAEFFDKAYNVIKATLDGEKRALLTIKFALIVMKYLDNQDTTDDEKDFGKSNPSPGDEPAGPQMDGPSAPHPTHSDHSTYMTPVDKVASPPPVNSEDNTELSMPNDKDDIDALRQQEQHGLRDPHTFIKNIKYSSTENSIGEMRTIINPIVNPLINVMRKHINRRLSEVQHFTSSGDLDMTTIHIPYNPNKFCVKNIFGDAFDGIFYLLIDLSGSMCWGKKYEYVALAAMALGECLDKLNIPFAILGFTEHSSCSQTLVLKDTKESFKSKRSNLAMIYGKKSPKDIPIWAGNVDEVNVANTCERLLKEPHKDKYLIVLSDGETCGSEVTLHKVVQHYDKRGIHTLGIGVMTDAVDRIYPNHITFMSANDLKELPKFLGKYLVSRIGGGK